MQAKGSFEVLFFKTEQGRSQAQEFLDSLPLKVRAKVAKWIRRLEEYGPDLPRPYADIVRGKIRELRLIFASHQYRFLYFFYDKYIVITNGFVKKAKIIPENEIERANNAMLDFEDRVKRGETVL